MMTTKAAVEFIKCVPFSRPAACLLSTVTRLLHAVIFRHSSSQFVRRSYMSSSAVIRRHAPLRTVLLLRAVTHGYAPLRAVARRCVSLSWGDECLAQQMGCTENPFFTPWPYLFICVSLSLACGALYLLAVGLRSFEARDRYKTVV